MSGRRIAALILGWIATLGNAVPLLFVVLLSLTSKGASSMVVLFPVVVLMFTGVIWLVLGLIGLALTADMMDVRLPRIMWHRCTAVIGEWTGRAHLRALTWRAKTHIAAVAPYAMCPEARRAVSSLSGSRHLKHLQDKLNEMESARSVAVNLTYPSAKDASAPDGIGP